jgi:A/G-specific adenine glycosylase
LTGKGLFGETISRSIDQKDLIAARASFHFLEARDCLLGWYKNVARKLPWRDPITPYRVWVSEIMLQQTTVSVVVGYFERFMVRFPTVDLLAESSENDLLKLWEGLGYYQRARNLHRAAKIIALSGVFPKTKEQWELLPGIGRSTAGAIASIAFGEREPILDANVRRVNRRLFQFMESPGKGDKLEYLWTISRAFVELPGASPGEVNQALMDLGATVCRIRAPLCEECPLSPQCLTSRFSLDPSLPTIKKSFRRKIVRTALVLPPEKGLILVIRSGGRFLEGLWDFPGDVTDGYLSSEKLGRILGRVSHVYTHIEEEVLIIEVPVLPTGYENTRMFSGIGEAMAVPLNGAAQKVIRVLAKRELHKNNG